MPRCIWTQSLGEAFSIFQRMARKTFTFETSETCCRYSVDHFSVCSASYSSIAKDSGSSNGTGKVDFDCQETAERAIRDLNGTTLDGCQILVRSLADVPAHFWLTGRITKTVKMSIHFGLFGMVTLRLKL